MTETLPPDLATMTLKILSPSIQPFLSIKLKKEISILEQARFANVFIIREFISIATLNNEISFQN